jgi:hypothetical protein
MSASSRSFTPTRQGNPCLVCGDIKGRCRQTPEALNLCMDSSGVLPGFKYLGQTKDGLWAKYVTNDGQEQNQDDRIQQQQQLRAQRAAAEAQRHAEALPAIERDRLYNQLLNQLPLHPADRADLHRRGITDEQIKAWGIRSVDQWQPLEQELSYALPGLSLDGRLWATYQYVILLSESNSDIQNNVSQIPLKRLTRAENKSLIDQTKEVMSDKWYFKRKKTPTWQKEF